KEYDPVFGREGVIGKRGREIGIHALRGGTVAGIHEVGFYGNDEILEIRHTANSRMIFVDGALKAARFLCGQEPGLYSMVDLLK
ncbi:dihydrodipicolinate reductase C-terminal domain-containing protein, partial [uncultured Dubosiella sp.]